MRATALNQESLALRRGLGDTRGIAICLNQIGELARLQGDYVCAAALYAESLALRRKLGDTHGIANCLNGLAGAARLQGEYAHAMALYRESLTQYQRIDEKLGCVECLEGLAPVACAQGYHARAVVLLAAAAAARRAIGAPLQPVERANHDRTLADLRAALDSEEFEAAWAEGTGLSLEEAIAETLAEDVETADRVPVRANGNLSQRRQRQA